MTNLYVQYSCYCWLYLHYTQHRQAVMLNITINTLKIEVFVCYSADVYDFGCTSF